ncbi:MAG: hypothetical protein GQ542_02070 [Desulforhopalus sp.]|jgi:hypothetical protein|nr:hypothetical protein [Desulforhopalus sp.]
MFKNHNVCMAVGGGLIIVSILIMSYNLWVSVPIFMIGGYLAFIKAPQTHLHSMSSRERVGEEGIETKAQTVSRNSRCPCGSGKKYRNCCQHR